MKVEKEEWESKLNNLHTRTKGITSEHQIDYKTLLKKVYIGKKVLDVGCGTMWLKNYIPSETYYFGIDAYLESGMGRLKCDIESLVGSGEAYDTLFVFAALDGMMDLEKAFDAMKGIAIKNIVILTGINIQPDLYHTHLITEQLIQKLMEGFKLTHRTQVHEKIVFLEYTKEL